MSVNRSHLMGDYDPALLFVAAANILMHSDPGTQIKKAMKCAGFKQVDIEYDTYQNIIDRLKKKIVASNLYQIVVRDVSIVALQPSHIVVRDGSTSYP